MKDIKTIKCEDKEYPNKLLEIEDFPKQIYAIGNYELINKTSIAIVGSRNCTPYGAKYAKEFAKELSKRGLCIVSGMAIGIDANAHIGAMQEQGKTIAVLRFRI